MHLSDTQAQLLKNWLIKKLENDSDADSDVLADYVLALVRGDSRSEDLRASCIENLRDFLQDGTEIFVDQVLTAIKTGSYDPDQRPPLVSERLPPSGPRKRTFDDRGDDTAQHSRHGGHADRAIKQPRRGGRGGRHTQQGAQSAWAGETPSFTPGMNMQEALGAMMAMQQAMGLPPLPGMEQFSTQLNGADSTSFNASLLPQSGRAGAFHHTQRGARGGRGRGAQSRGGRRSDFSSTAPNNDRSITSIVVEKIPDDKLDDQSVRDFFDQFGTIQHLDLRPQDKLAVISFTNYDEANAAYTSPKVIFDNRFVKVFWHKPNGGTQKDHRSIAQSSTFEDVEMAPAEPAIDHQEIARRQEEAQKKHEDAKKARDVAARQKTDIEAKLKAMDAERAKMAELLARKAIKSAGNEVSTVDGTITTESEQTRGLKAQLAKLEAEAKSLGIDPNVDDPAPNAWSSTTPWRGQRGARGRAAFSTRGRGAFRGAWPATSARGGAVKRLDNRPRTVAVVFPKGTYDELDEAMRQYLLFTNQLEQAVLSRHPDRADAAMLVFEERYRAENFMATVKGPNGIPNIGSVDTAWMPNPQVPVMPAVLSHKTPEIDPAVTLQPAVKTDLQDTKMDDVDQTPATAAPAAVVTATASPREQVGDLDVDEGNQWD